MTRTKKAIGIAVLLPVLVFFALVLWPSGLPPAPDPETSRQIRNVRIVDVVTGSISEPQTVAIRNGRIAAIGNDVQQRGVPVLDGQGSYLLPGFWDMHIHSFQLSPQLHLPLWIAGGVTSARDMMDCPGEADTLIACHEDKQRWNRLIANGELASPRIAQIASFYLERSDMAPSEARRLVRAYRARGLDAIKVYNRLSHDAFLAAADEARLSQMKLVGHLPKAVALPQAIAAGQDSFEHGHVLPRHCFDKTSDWRAGRLDETDPVALTQMIIGGFNRTECEKMTRAMAAADAWLVPTHVTREEDARAADPAYLADPALDYLDPLSRWAFDDDRSASRAAFPGEEGRATIRAYFDHSLRLTGLAHANGVKVLVGTDSPIGGLRFHDELQHLVHAGMGPASVLKAATLDSARFAGEDHISGSVDIGKRADLILLRHNPLADISNTRSIAAVIQGGRLYDRQRLDALQQFVKDQAHAPHNWAKLLWGFARSSVSSEL